MPKSRTHNEVLLRPPPGVRFVHRIPQAGEVRTSISGNDCVLEFQRGKEREIVNWLHDWVDTYIKPEAEAYEANANPYASESPAAAEMLSQLTSAEQITSRATPHAIRVEGEEVCEHANSEGVQCQRAKGHDENQPHAVKTRGGGWFSL